MTEPKVNSSEFLLFQACTTILGLIDIKDSLGSLVKRISDWQGSLQK